MGNKLPPIRQSEVISVLKCLQLIDGIYHTFKLGPATSCSLQDSCKYLPSFPDWSETRID